MARSRTSPAWLALFGACLFLSFRPVAPLEGALATALSPLRWAAELGSPLRWLRVRRVQAAEHAMARNAAQEAAEGAEAVARLAARALPRDPALRSGRAFVPAEVVARPVKDECWLAVGSLGGIESGAPVVCGDAYVGRIVELRPAPGGEGLVRVQLVTAASFRVGAEVLGDEPVYMVLGGVRVSRGRAEARAVRLDVHQPSARPPDGGLVRVHELFADADAVAVLAEGFRLGELHRPPLDDHGRDARVDPWVEPELDFLDGLFQLAVIVRPERAEARPARPASALEDGHWLGTRALTLADASPWRSTLKLPLGEAQGIRAGAAVTGAGARLVGRVDRVGRTTADVALLSDPGFSLTAIACVAGEDEPRILGRLITLGRGAKGSVRMRWWVRIPSTGGAGAAPRRARLFTGSGDRGLPGGLFLGEAWLPALARAGDEIELELEPGFDPAEVRTLFVRRDAEELGP